MAADSAEDLDPQAFLKTVRDLSDKRQREDNERYEALEQQILQDRTARLERKLERERSLSPAKTPQSTRSYRASTPSFDDEPKSPGQLSRSRDTSRRDSLRSVQSEQHLSPLPSDQPTSPAKPISPSALMPSRANTLSWQRRPQSGTRGRPLSLLAAENASRASLSGSNESRPQSRDGSNRRETLDSSHGQDLAWSRPMWDASGSASSREEERDTYSGPETHTTPAIGRRSSREDLLSQVPRAQVFAGRPLSTRLATHREVSGEFPGRPPPDEDTKPVDSSEGPALFGRTTPSITSPGSMPSRRPSSPTKGMGGFVESAMMKRTASISKWSNQPGGLERSDSSATLNSPLGISRSGTRTSFGMSMPDFVHDGGASSSRPGSRHSNYGTNDPQELSPTRTGGSLHSRARSMASLRDNSSQPVNVAPTFSPPLSPSKKWGRSTRSSWLESALARPESPTKQPISPSQTQPQWMVDLGRSSQHRNNVASVESPPSVSGTRPSNASPERASQASTRPAYQAYARPSQEVAPSETKLIAPPSTISDPWAILGKPTSRDAAPEVEKPSVVQPQSAATMRTPPTQAGEFAKTTTTPSGFSPSVASPMNRLNTPRDLGIIASPRTTSQTDFPTALKPRASFTDNGSSDQPEFKSALGNLRKAETKNYVAPDIFKDNILSGKAALNVTGGPKKTKRVDEFKESILQKKAEMKAKGPEVGLKPGQKPPPPTQVPEALRIRQELQRSSSTVVGLKSDSGSPRPSPVTEVRDVTQQTKPKPLFPSLSKTASSIESNLPTPKEIKPSPASIGVDAAASRLIPEQKTPTPAMSATQEMKPVRTFEGKITPVPDKVSAPISKPVETIIPRETPKPAPSSSSTLQSSATKSSALANKFNPALAGLLARGPPAMSSGKTASKQRVAEPALARVESSSKEGGADTPATELTHMTKDRARGPKRRKPKSSTPTAKDTRDDASAATKPSATQAAAREPAAVKSKSVSERADQVEVNGGVRALPKKPSTEPTTPKATSRPIPPKGKSPAVRSFSNTLSEKALPKDDIVTTKKAGTWPIKVASPDKSIGQSQTTLVKTDSLPQRTASSTFPAKPLEASTADLSSTDKITESQDDNKENVSGTFPSVKNAAAKWSQAQSLRSVSGPKEPVKLPSKADEEAALHSAGLLSRSPTRQDLSLNNASICGNGAQRPTAPNLFGDLPLRPAKSSRVVSQTLGTEDPSSSVSTPRAVQQSPYVPITRLREHFHELPSISTPLTIDTQSCLDSPVPQPSIKSVRKTVQLLNDNGKLSLVPANKEHILYSASKYVLTHVFDTASDQRQTEVYLWAGTDVPTASIEDAQVFAKRVAKDEASNSGSRTNPPVTVVNQEREPVGFLEALGGIVIIRRGKHESSGSQPYMLCGRPHLGYLSFDETHLTMDALCGRYPYIIADPSKGSKVYLWAGVECTPEALGSARLISMDIATGADVAEVTPGAEPPSLTSLLTPRDSSRPEPARASSLVGVHGKVSPRLFRIDGAPSRRPSFFGGLWGKTAAASGSSSAARPGSSHHNARPASSASTSPGGGGDEEPSAIVTELAPFAQADLAADAVYLLDCIASVIVLPGPALAATGERWEVLFGQACLFAAEYAVLAAGVQERSRVPAGWVLLGGDVPREVKGLFRSWDEGRGVWGKGVKVGEEDGMIRLEDVLDVCGAK